MKCSRCGAEVSDKARFCKTCGAEVTFSAQPTQVVQPQPSPRPVQPQPSPRPVQPQPSARPVQTGRNVASPAGVAPGGTAPGGTAPGSGEPPQRGKKTGLVIGVIVAVVVVLAAAGGITWWFMSQQGPSGSQSAESADEPSESASAGSSSSGIEAFSLGSIYSSTSASASSPGTFGLSGTASSASSSAAPTAQTYADSAFVGTWKLTTLIVDGYAYNESELASIGVSMTVVLEPNGVATISAGGETGTTLWYEESPTSAVMVSSEEPDLMYLRAGKLLIESVAEGGNMMLEFVKA